MYSGQIGLTVGEGWGRGERTADVPNQNVLGVLQGGVGGASHHRREKESFGMCQTEFEFFVRRGLVLRVPRRLQRVDAIEIGKTRFPEVDLIRGNEHARRTRGGRGRGCGSSQRS